MDCRQEKTSHAISKKRHRVRHIEILRTHFGESEADTTDPRHRKGIMPGGTLANHKLHKHHAHTGIRYTTHSLASFVGNHHRTRHATGLLSGISII